MADIRENAIEWITGEKRVTITITQGRLVSKIKRLAEKYPNEVEIVTINKDGTLLAHIPLNYIKINRASRDLTEEDREELAERARNNFHNDKD